MALKVAQIPLSYKVMKVVYSFFNCGSGMTRTMNTVFYSWILLDFFYYTERI